jgi:hypothetical protein
MRSIVHARMIITKAGLFEKVTVARWRKAYFDRKKLI